MAGIKKETEPTQENEPRIYEVGYLLVPTLSSDALPETAGRLKDVIRDVGGVILAEGEPKMKNLAYKIGKVVEHSRSSFETAYFGWILFTAPPEGAVAVKSAYDVASDVLRFLILKGTKEDLTPKKKKPQTVKPRQRSEAEAVASAEDIDKAIDELVISE